MQLALQRLVTVGVQGGPPRRGRGQRHASRGKAVQCRAGASSLREFTPEDFELVRLLGRMSFKRSEASATTVSWKQLDGSSAPDALRVEGARNLPKIGGSDILDQSSSTTSEAVVLYAARFIGDGSASTGGSAGCLLKEHPPRTRDIGTRELAAYTALLKPAAKAAAAAAEVGGKAVGALPLLFFSEFDIKPSPGGNAGLYEPPLAPVVGFFEGSSALPSDDDNSRLWVVQRWEGLRNVLEYPSQLAQKRAEEAAKAAQKKPMGGPAQFLFGGLSSSFQETTRIRARFAYIASLIAGMVRALAYCHSRRVAHGSVDASVFLVSTYDESSPAGPSVRISNFGFAVVGNEENGDELAEAARGDMRALGAVIAELVFTALASEGCQAPTSAADMSRIIETVFSLDWPQIRRYCEEGEEEWATAVEFLDEEQGTGWKLLERIFDKDSFSADAADILKLAAQLEKAHPPDADS